jgi:hypothetical protein
VPVEVEKRPETATLEMCTELVEEFWDMSWAICCDRFLQTTAPIIAGLELRDTWLRIVEVGIFLPKFIRNFINTTTIEKILGISDTSNNCLLLILIF